MCCSLDRHACACQARVWGLPAPTPDVDEIALKKQLVAALDSGSYFTHRRHTGTSLLPTSPFSSQTSLTVMSDELLWMQ